jgi:hypothetical protein
LVLLRTRLALVLLRTRLALVLLRTRLALVLLWTRLALVLLTRLALLPLLHLLAALLHLLVILALLIGRQYAEDLLAQIARRLLVARASLRMCLGVLIDHRLYPLLLVAGEIDGPESLHPAVLKLPFAGSRAILGLPGRRGSLLSLCGQRAHECDKQGACRENVHLHTHDVNGSAHRAPERPIRTCQAA